MAWGAKALPGGGYWSMPKLTMPGALLVGDAGGMVDTVALKGVHHCIKSGILAAEAIYARAQARRDRLLAPTRSAIEESSVGKELYEVRNTRQPFQKGFIKGGAARQPRRSRPRASCPPGAVLAPQRRRARCSSATRKDALSQAGRQVHVRQAVVRLHHRQRDPRRRAEPHPRAEERPARGRRDVELDVPGRASTRSPTTRPRRATST